MKFICHWSDNRNRLGGPTRNSPFLQYRLPFVQIEAKTKAVAQSIVAAFNSDPELGEETDGLRAACIPRSLLEKYGFFVPSN